MINSMIFWLKSEANARKVLEDVKERIGRFGIKVRKRESNTDIMRKSEKKEIKEVKLGINEPLFILQFLV